MKRSVLNLAMAGLALTAATSAPAAQVTQDNFLLKTTNDLVALCGASQNDPLYTAAVNFCHGFAVGTYRMLEIEEAASVNKRKQICIGEDPTVTRNSAIAGFVTWAADKPNVLASQPGDGLTQYLLNAFSCKR